MELLQFLDASLWFPFRGLAPRKEGVRPLSRTQRKTPDFHWENQGLVWWSRGLFNFIRNVLKCIVIFYFVFICAPKSAPPDSYSMSGHFYGVS